MQPRAPVPQQPLHLRHQQLPLPEKRPDRQLVRGRPFADDAAGEGDRAEGQLREEGGGDVDAPALGFDGADAPDDEVADGGRVARGEGRQGEELVRVEEGAG